MRAPSPSPVDRALRIFTDVRAGEGGIALILSLNAFLVLSSYYILKPVREALLLSRLEPEVKSYLSAAMAVLLLFLVWGYSRLVNRFTRSTLIAFVTTLFILCMAAFWIWSRTGVVSFAVLGADIPVGIVFYVWVGIFNVMVVAQFWSFSNDLYSNDQGKRLFPIAAVGANVGAWVGAVLTEKMLRVLDEFELLLVSGGLLFLTIPLTLWLSRRGPTVRPDSQPQEGDTAPIASSPLTGVGLVFRHRYLAFIALLVIVLNLVNTNGEYILGKLARQHGQEQTATAVADAIASNQSLRFGDREIAGDPQSEEAQDTYRSAVIGDFYAGFFGWVNLLAVLLQLFVVSRLVKWGGLRWGLLLLPLIALGTYGLILAIPALTYARFGKVAENATDYSVNNTVRHMLFLPTSRGIKYKAKQAVDALMHRIGDVLSAVLVFFAAAQAELGIQAFSGINLGLVAIWLVLVLAIAVEHRRVEAGQRPALSDPEPVAPRPPAGN